jgi:hypothetical protein
MLCRTVVGMVLQDLTWRREACYYKRRMVMTLPSTELTCSMGS